MHPANRTLNSIKVAKTAKAYMVFWGATGIATSPVGALRPSPNGKSAATLITKGSTGARARNAIFASRTAGGGVADAAGRNLP